MHPIITIFCPFTRRWAVDNWISYLSKVNHDPTLTNLAIIVDGDEPYILKTLQRFAEQHQYRSLHFKHNTGWGANEVSIGKRRPRIADVHEQSKDLISKCDGDIVIGFEDDTVFDRLEDFSRLYQPIVGTDQVGFVEGVQIGRWQTRMVGAWRADDEHYPTHIETLLPTAADDAAATQNGYEEITGGGWYGYATRRSLYLQAPYFYSPSFPWGPDVNYGFWVRQRGYQCLVDWQTMFGHNDNGTIMYPDDPKARLVKVTYTRREDNGKWDRNDYDRR